MNDRANGQTVLNGTIHGKTIELEHESGLPDGQAVAVTIKPLQEQRLPPGEGIRRSAGAWSDDIEGLDRFLEWNRKQREQNQREVLD